MHQQQVFLAAAYKSNGADNLSRLLTDQTRYRDSAADGGYATLDNLKYAKNMNINNIVFNKVVGSLQNQVSSKNMETRLKKWRSSIEAVISNLKRGFNLDRCYWKGWVHFQSKVMWSALAYNFRVFTDMVMKSILQENSFAKAA
ncbi:MAG: transposase [Anaerolineaceae bacterium]|nr:transposase [Anaerolineaceae bacterium]